MYLGHLLLGECSWRSVLNKCQPWGKTWNLPSFRKQIPSYMVYGETYFRRFGKEKVLLPAARQNLAKAPMGISLAHTPCGLPPPFLTQRLLASGLLGPWTLFTSHSFLIRALHCSPAFLNFVSSPPLIHSYLLSSCPCIRHHSRCWNYSRK